MSHKLTPELEELFLAWRTSQQLTRTQITELDCARFLTHVIRGEIQSMYFYKGKAFPGPCRIETRLEAHAAMTAMREQFYERQTPKIL
jgi:hypothetical protein